MVKAGSRFMSYVATVHRGIGNYEQGHESLVIKPRLVSASTVHQMDFVRGSCPMTIDNCYK